MMSNYGKHFCWATLLVAIAFSGTAMAQVFVVPGGAGNADGTSWDNAYGSIQDALDDDRAADDDVWVAAGTYTEFEVVWPAEVAGYGGFVGDESSLSDRDVSTVGPTPNETIIDGDTQGGVVLVADGATGTRIDGFTITGGNNQGAGFVSSAIRYAGCDNSNTLANSWIYQNHQEDDAIHGTVWLQGSSPNFDNCVFEDNRSDGLASSLLVNDGSTPLITNSTFRNHDGASWHGPVVMRNGGSHATFEDCLFENNVGGTISFRDGEESNVTLIGCVFRNNDHSGGQGAAVQVRAAGPGDVLIQDCVFENNIATHGGAVALWDTEKIVTIERSMFIGNESLEHGAAVVVHAAGTANIENSAFMENHGGGISNAIFAWHEAGEIPTQYTVDYCSFYGNTGGQGFTVRADGVSGTLDNSIVWGNEGNGVTVPITNSIVEGGDDWSDDPMFRDADSGDLRLLADSPAIDQGVDPVPDTDLLGVDRPQGDAADVGAYEYEPLSVSISGPNTATVEQNVTLTLEHNAIGDATIVWSKDGEVLDGEEFETLPLSEVTMDDAGVYSVTVEAENGEATDEFTLNVVAGLPVSSPLALALVALALALCGMCLVARRNA